MNVEAMERAVRKMCFWCRRGDPEFEFYGTWYHRDRVGFVHCSLPWEFRQALAEGETPVLRVPSGE